MWLGGSKPSPSNTTDDEGLIEGGHPGTLRGTWVATVVIILPQTNKQRSHFGSVCLLLVVVSRIGMLTRFDFSVRQPAGGLERRPCLTS